MQVGKQFDALLIDTQAYDPANPVFYTFPDDSMAVSFYMLTYIVVVFNGDTWGPPKQVLVIQWNPSITDTIGTQHFVRYSEVSLTQGLPVYFR